MRKKLSLAELNPMDSRFKVRGTLSAEEFIEKQQEFIVVKQLQNLAPRTIKDYYYSFGHVNNWIKTSITDWGDRTIDKQLFTSYVGYLVGKYSPATVNIRIRYLKVFLKWLYAEEIVDEDFYSRLRLLRVPLDKIQPLSTQEVRKIFKQLDLAKYEDYRDWVAMIVMLNTGIRANELCNLLISDLDIKKRLLRVRSVVAKSREERILPLSKKTVTYIQRLVDVAVNNNELYIFNSVYGGRLQTLSLIKRYSDHGKKAGITKHTSCHVWRHTFATNAVKAGMSIYHLQKILAHKDLNTTRIYIQLTTEDLQKSLEKADIMRDFF